MQVLAALLLWPVSAIIQGFTLKVLWGWFMVTTFAMQVLTIPQALGISLIASYLTHQMSDKTNTNDKSIEPIAMIFAAILRAGICLAVGWVYHLFMAG